MHDIHTEKDIKVLVDQFYGKVRSDALLAPIFNAVITGSWEKHLQIMCDFWSSLLLYTRKYSSDPMPKHMALPVAPVHFERWKELFNETVDTYFTGDVANTAKTRAKNIAALMQSIKESNRVAPDKHKNTNLQ